nr:DUF488 domain-containing protein [Nitrospirota bacterium]
MIRIKRIYGPPSMNDGARFLVDRLWPRGVSKDAVREDRWLKEVAPSDALRRWFAHDPTKWDAFRLRYAEELDAKPETWAPLLRAAKEGPLTLLFAAKDEQANNAAALKEYLETRLAS